MDEERASGLSSVVAHVSTQEYLERRNPKVGYIWSLKRQIQIGKCAAAALWLAQRGYVVSIVSVGKRSRLGYATVSILATDSLVRKLLGLVRHPHGKPPYTPAE